LHAHKLQVTIPQEADREIAAHLPDDFLAGPAEVIVLAGQQSSDSARHFEDLGLILEDWTHPKAPTSI
jgi:hypothetical protein